MPHESLEKQIDQWCKHYASPARNETCRMGINYLELAGGDRKGYLNRLPCIRTHYKDDVVAECSLREWRTPEEIAESAKQTRNAAVNYMTARAAITDHLDANKLPKRNVEGRIPCPICNTGTLRFGIAHNGHCHAACNTSGCVNWME